MYYNLIKKYVKKLNKEDIINFASKENIKLTTNELEIIYDSIKTRWEEIYENGIKVINEYKNKLNTVTYNKLIELYNKYKKNYK